MIDREQAYQQNHAQYSDRTPKSGSRKQKGIIARFLENLAKENEKKYGGRPPCCH